MNPEPLLYVIFFTLVMPAAWMFLVPMAKRLRRGAEAAADPGPEVMAELERLSARVTELEERLEFAERLLANRESERLPGG